MGYRQERKMIYQTVKDDIKACMKQARHQELTALRTWDSQIQLVAKESRSEISDELVLDVLSKEMKKLRDSLEMFQKGSREDLIQKTESEIKQLKEYLPKELSDEEIKSIVEKAISEASAISIKDMRLVMSIVVKETKGKADGKKVSQLVREKLL